MRSFSHPPPPLLQLHRIQVRDAKNRENTSGISPHHSKQVECDLYTTMRGKAPPLPLLPQSLGRRASSLDSLLLSLMVLAALHLPHPILFLLLKTDLQIFFCLDDVSLQLGSSMAKTNGQDHGHSFSSLSLASPSPAPLTFIFVLLPKQTSHCLIGLLWPMGDHWGHLLGCWWRSSSTLGLVGVNLIDQPKHRVQETPEEVGKADRKPKNGSRERIISSSKFERYWWQALSLHGFH